MFTCAACGGKARVLAANRDREVVKKIFRHLKLPVNAPVILPARSPAQLELPYCEVDREVQLDKEVAIEWLPAWMCELPKARRRPPRGRKARRASNPEVNETVQVEDLPSWMRAAPPVPGRGVEPASDFDELPDLTRLRRWMRGGGEAARVSPRSEWDCVDETPSVENLPPWMRVPRPRRKALAHWDTREQRDGRAIKLYPDESPRMELLPGWMRGGWLARSAPPAAMSWDQVDPPGPEDVAAQLEPPEQARSEAWDGIDEVYPDDFAQPSSGEWA